LRFRESINSPPPESGPAAPDGLNRGRFRALFAICSHWNGMAMLAHPHEPPPEIRLTEAEAIALAYHRAARGDAWNALVAAITDALTDLDAVERRAAQQSRLISRGYARCRTGAT
jgi:hypothetical protein